MKTYKQVKNLVHNEMGISKEYIQAIIREEVRQQVEAKVNAMFEESSFRGFIANQIARTCQGKVPTGFYNVKSFTEYFKDTVHSVVQQEVRSRIRFNINVDDEARTD